MPKHTSQNTHKHLSQMWGTSLTDRFRQPRVTPNEILADLQSCHLIIIKAFVMGQKCRVPSNKILRWYLIIPSTCKQNRKLLAHHLLINKRENVYTVSPFQSYRSLIASYMWEICFGIILTDSQVLEQRYFQRACGHKCHSVNSQCAAYMCHCRPENESASEEREKHSKSDQIKGVAQHI